MRSQSLFRSVFGVVLSLAATVSVPAQSLDWVKQAGGTISTGGQSVESADSIAVDAQGNTYVTGTFRTEATLGIGEPNQTVLHGVGAQSLFVAKFDPNGLLVWARAASGNGIHQNWVFGIAVDPAGNSYITGWLSYLTTQFDFGNGVAVHNPGSFVAKYNTEGTPLWATTLDPNGTAWGLDVDANGNSFVASSASDSGAGFTADRLVEDWPGRHAGVGQVGRR